MCFLSVYRHWHPVSAGMEKGNCTTGGKWPCSNYTTILPPLCCHCHLARTRTSGGRWAVYSASCTQSSYIQMGWGHLRRSLAGLLLSRRRELGKWQVDAIRVESGCVESGERQWRHFDLENWVRGPFSTKLYGQGGERPESCWSVTWHARRNVSSGFISRIHLKKKNLAR